MTDAERREAARQFSQKWANRGREDEDDRSFWIDFLQDVIGLDHVTDRIEFQKKVLNSKGTLSNRIDAYIPETKVLIEQKTLGIDLSKPQQGHGGKTPYEQAKEYDNALPVSEKSKWIIVSNFAEIWIYDMDSRVPEPVKVMLSEIPNKYSLFEFLVDKKQQKISQEMEVSVKAGEFVGLVYDALYKQYIDPTSDRASKSLNMLCVRLVFCLYADDAHIFGDSGHMFHDYMAQFDSNGMRKALIELFKILDTPEDKRDPYDDSDLSKFPYVNGGLFADEDIEIPKFTDEIRDILLAKASEGFNWSQISPTIFGAVFESTLNPETRRSGGMHYTSIENIHKVIDPLFLDELKAELAEIKEIKALKTRNPKLRAFRRKLAKLKWLDPACGSGNFLTETYLSIRRLENEVIETLNQGQIGMYFADDEESDDPILVSISQFYGIEINDFAVTVAKTALWIAESQMIKETERIIRTKIDFLPLKTNAFIHEGNALRIDWEEVCPKSELSYIMGNPPFVGVNYMSDSQRKDMDDVCNDIKRGKLDYVACWYIKAASIMMGTNIRAALVSTNSITQGEQAIVLWNKLFQSGVHIDFAHRTFIWDSEASSKAQVHCVIVGFSIANSSKECVIFENGIGSKAKQINGYLLDAPIVFIEERAKPLCNVQAIIRGSQATDDGNYLFTDEEKDEFLKKEPFADKYFRRFMMGKEFINNIKRWCLWMPDIAPNELRKLPYVMERVNAVRQFRLDSKNTQTKASAAIPWRFGQYRKPSKRYIAFAKVSSERRRYIPFGFLTDEVIPGDKLFTIPDATLYEFGILTSNVHMAWMRMVCGRLKSDYSYSTTIVYNNFPWCDPTEAQKTKIEQTAQGILDARALYPNSSLADLYDPLTMPPELQKAHSANDRAVMQAYGFDVKTTSEADCVAKLMQMYKELVEGN